jgi:hypothetical protein
MPRAVSNARITFLDLPLVLIPISTSPGLPIACTCRANTPSKSKSFAYAVRNDVSVVKAIAGNPGRTKSADNRLVNSAAKC